MAEHAALPFFTDSYLSDTSHLSDAEHGIYLQILMAMWRSPQCCLPDDNEWLSRKFRRSVGDVVNGIRPLIEEFCICKQGWITQKRLIKTWEWCKEKSKKGSKSANLRWNKDNGGCERSTSKPFSSNASSPVQSIPIIKETKKKSYQGDFESFWLAYPNKSGSKHKASIIFNQLLKEGITHETLINSCRQFSERCNREKTEARFIPHATTWLNGRRWETVGNESVESPTKKGVTTL